MSLGLGRHAKDDQPESAEEARQSATRGPSDTPGAYADSGASPAPAFSGVWGSPDASGASESPAAGNSSGDSEPGTAGAPVIPGTVVDSDTSDAPEPADAPEASSTSDASGNPQTVTAFDDSGAPDTVGAREASVPGDAPAAVQDPDEPAASDPGATVTDVGPDAGTGTATGAGAATDADTATGASAATDADTAVDAGVPSAPEPAAGAASVPDQAGPEGMTGGPSAAGTTAAASTPGAAAASVVPADGEAAVVPESSAADGRPSVAAGLEAAAGDLDGPLLGDVEGLRASWQRIQIGFVDDPREAVTDAADLVEHTAQALIGALQQRQRLLRSLWDRDSSLDGLGASPASSPAESQPTGRGRPVTDIPDTEDLRLLIQRYRTMFNEICRP